MNAEELERELGDNPNEGLAGAFSGNWASMETNEPFEPSLAGKVKRLNPRYLVGIGFGNILTHVPYCFKPDEIKGIVSVDVLPHVVALGRATRHLLRECGTPQEFVRTVKDPARLGKALSQTALVNNYRIANYVEDALQERVKQYTAQLGSEPHERTNDELESIFEGTFNPFYPYFYGGHTMETADIPAMLLMHYPLFRRLANEGRMGIVAGNLFDINLLEGAKALEGYADSNVIAYLSNATNNDSYARILSSKPSRDGMLIISASPHTSSHEFWFPENFDDGVPRYELNGQSSRSIVLCVEEDGAAENHSVNRYFDEKELKVVEKYIFYARKEGNGAFYRPPTGNHWYRLTHATLDHFDRLLGLDNNEVDIRFSFDGQDPPLYKGGQR